MNKITELKKAIGVFHTYGIPLTGKGKNAHFYQHLNMDKVFVNGLIYELEFQLKHELAENKLSYMESPLDLLKEFFANYK
jgi:D-alanine-D-alanine ligase-like ATP-grasp enzyme